MCRVGVTLFEKGFFEDEKYLSPQKLTWIRSERKTEVIFGFFLFVLEALRVRRNGVSRSTWSYSLAGHGCWGPYSCQ